MRIIPRLLLLLACLPVCLALAADPPAQPRNKREASTMFSEDGLAKVAVKGIDVAYMRPGASLSGYKRVLLKPVTVSLRKDWNRSAGMTGIRARPEDIERVRGRASTFVREEFEQQMKADGVEQAQEPGEDVLELDLSVVDLYAAAPDIQVAARSEVYAVSAGEATLVGELRDSVTGETLFRFYDHGQAREWTRPRRILFNENETEARKIARDWALSLRNGVRAARAAAPAPAPAK